jgi:hypothetical protein
VIAAISDQALITVNSLELLGIVYLAVALSKLRADLSRLQGQFEQYAANHKEERR